MQHAFHPRLFYARFPKGERTAATILLGALAVYKRVGIRLFHFRAELADHLFITGKFDIPAQQNIRRP